MKRILFLLNEKLVVYRDLILRNINRGVLILMVLAAISIALDYGYAPTGIARTLISGIQVGTVFIFAIGQASRIFFRREKGRRRWLDPVIGLAGLLLVFLLFVLPAFTDNVIFGLSPMNRRFILHLYIGFVFILELGDYAANSPRFNLNPAAIFALSFFVMSLLGTLLLMLPRSTTHGISFVDAWFTSTSAVCVTGLTTVSTATAFTGFGKLVILFLIQAGGLGVMTFTSFFGFFFQGTSSLQSRFFMRDFVNEDNINRVVRTLINVVLVTFLIEAVGALLIFSSIEIADHGSFGEAVFFSIFHSVSAFCNAGFSTLGDGLHDPMVQYNYGLHMIIAVLVIFGGLGFPIMFNFVKLFRQRIKARYAILMGRPRLPHRARIIHINSRLAIVTMVGLLLIGFVFFLVMEWNHSLKDLSFGGKLVEAFFGAVTPRTAGFNTVDLNQMAMATVFLYLGLMWVGASPGSTGGGIKTTTFGVGVATIINIAKGKSRVDMFRRQVADDSIRRAMVVILLSFLVMGMSVIALGITESHSLENGQMNMQNVVFEVVSAYGTVGLSLGVTGSLTSAGKVIIIICMFLGRVGTLTVLVALIQRVRNLSYTYPTENVMVT